MNKGNWEVVGALLSALGGVVLSRPRAIIRKRPLTSVLVVGITLFLVGWMGFGWLIYPVTYTNPGYAGLPPQQMANYVLTVSDLYSYDRNDARVRWSFQGWGGDRVACLMADQTADPFQRIRLEAAAYAVSGQPCQWEAAIGGGQEQ